MKKIFDSARLLPSGENLSRRALLRRKVGMLFELIEEELPQILSQVDVAASIIWPYADVEDEKYLYDIQEAIDVMKDRLDDMSEELDSRIWTAVTELEEEGAYVPVNDTAYKERIMEGRRKLGLNIVTAEEEDDDLPF